MKKILHAIYNKFYCKFIISNGYNALALVTMLISLYWSILLLLSMNTFGSTPSYQVVSTLLPETTLGILMLCLAGTKIFSLFMSSVTLIRGVSLISFMVWVFLGICFMMSNHVGTGWGTYFVIAFANILVYWKTIAFEERDRT